MTESEVKTKTFKLSFFKEFPTDEFRKIDDKLIELGYNSVIADNGNIVYEKVDL